MLTLTISLFHWLGFSIGVMSQYAGTVTEFGDVPAQLYQINNYYINLGVVSVACVGFKIPVTREQMEQDTERYKE
jgi:hypothetical protein